MGASDQKQRQPGGGETAQLKAEVLRLEADLKLGNEKRCSLKKAGFA